MFKIRFLVRHNLTFVRAHTQATFLQNSIHSYFLWYRFQAYLRHSRKVFEGEFASNPLTSAEAKVTEESQAQVKLAEADLNDIDEADVSAVKGYLLCLILLNKSVQYVERFSR